MNPVIEFEKLTVRFGNLEALKDVSGRFSGRSIGLLGPNGAGKTTMIHTLLGFYPPAGGSARIFGKDIVQDAREIKALIGYMPENDSFIAGMTAVRFVAMMAELTGIPANAALERAHEALFYVGLGEARYRTVETFSQGMKQLVKLAQAIVHGPRLLFLDEPTNGLDPPARLRMLRLIREITAHAEMHLVLSSHLLRDVEECCEEVLILKKGEVAVQCNLEEERRSNKKFVELETRGDTSRFIDAIERFGCEWAQSAPRRYKMVLPEGLKISQLYEAASEHEVQLRKFTFKRDSLEDIFLKAMGNENGSL
ncbi:MAG: ABC transporter ATP-binding protein [Acidobacteriota bacterium]|nr:MAG: ABC transporter ATP-binding protein [Acidobacteriota bacterium]